MNYNYGYDMLGGANSLTTTGPAMGSYVWLIVAFILSLIGCFVIYFFRLLILFYIPKANNL